MWTYWLCWCVRWSRGIPRRTSRQVRDTGVMGPPHLLHKGSTYLVVSLPTQSDSGVACVVSLPTQSDWCCMCCVSLPTQSDWCCMYYVSLPTQSDWCCMCCVSLPTQSDWCCMCCVSLPTQSDSGEVAGKDCSPRQGASIGVETLF